MSAAEKLVMTQKLEAVITEQEGEGGVKVNLTGWKKQEMREEKSGKSEEE